MPVSVPRSDAPVSREPRCAATLGRVRVEHPAPNTPPEENSMVNVRDVMTEAPKSVLDSDNLVHVARVMRDDDVGVVPVCDSSGKLLGMLTDRDLVVEVLASNDDPTIRQAGEMMRGELHTVEASEPVTRAVETMGRQRIRRLPVV